MLSGRVKAQRLVDSGKYHAAILVPVLRKQEVVKIANTRSYEQLPAKFTCFLPKPGVGIIMAEIKDLM